jgi:hypothetical protein
MKKNRVAWLAVVVAIAAVMSAVVAVQTEAGSTPRPPFNCKWVVCAYPDCEQTVIPPGQCCPVCVIP